MNKYYQCAICVIALIVVGIILIIQRTEGFTNYTLEGAMGPAKSQLLVQDIYPAIGKNEISNNDAADIWKDYPIFEVGSYEQITNNIRYPDNPDEGTCMPASMCGALYRDKKIGSNVIVPLPPVKPDCGRRIGYFDTQKNLLPFRTNMSNILY
jgi:hypothetical protein